MINKELEITIEAIARDAENRRHEYLTVEHILYALLHDEWGMDIILACGGDIDHMKMLIEEYFDESLPLLSENSTEMPGPTVAFKRVFETAVAHVQSAEKPEVDAGDMLSAIFREKDSHAVHFLLKEDISRLDVLNYISHGISKTVNSHMEGDPAEPKTEHENHQAGKASQKQLSLYMLIGGRLLLLRCFLY